MRIKPSEESSVVRKAGWWVFSTSDLSSALCGVVPLRAEGYELLQGTRLVATFVDDSATSACILEVDHNLWEIADVVVHQQGIVAFVVIEACRLVHVKAIKVQLGMHGAY